MHVLFPSYTTLITFINIFCIVLHNVSLILFQFIILQESFFFYFPLVDTFLCHSATHFSQPISLCLFSIHFVGRLIYFLILFATRFVLSFLPDIPLLWLFSICSDAHFPLKTLQNIIKIITL